MRLQTLHRPVVNMELGVLGNLRLHDGDVEPNLWVRIGPAGFKISFLPKGPWDRTEREERTTHGIPHER